MPLSLSMLLVIAAQGDASPWLAAEVETKASLRGLCAVDGFVCWASGAGGSVLRTTDGVQWTSIQVAGADELDFRDVHAFDENTALLLSAGTPARVYRTADGGESWRETYEAQHEGAFFDAMDFWDTERGLAFSDPIEGKPLVIRTEDGGRSWLELSPDRFPACNEGEAGFAASGTCLVTGPDGVAWIGTGGTNAARVFRTEDYGETWDVAQTPMRSTASSTGIFSLVRMNDGSGVAVGGDYTDDDSRTGNAARSSDGGETWNEIQIGPRGYRSCVALNPNDGTLVATGPGGSDVSSDGGLTWQPLSDEGFHTLSFGTDGALWASGSDGRIAKLAAPRAGLAKWRRFRGPNGSGVADGNELPAKIGPDEQVVWKHELGEGFSSPILSSQHVFLTGVENERLLVYAIERVTGERAWTREVPRPRRTEFHGKNGPASPSVAVDEDTVVAFFDEYGLIAYGHDGSGRWRMPLGPFDNVYGMGISPVIAGGVVVLGCDQVTGSFVIGIDKVSGRELWRVARPNAISGSCTPVTRDVNGRTEVLLAGSFLLDAYDARTGERRWWFEGLPAEMKSVPVLDGERLWIHGNGSPANNLGNQVDLPDFAEALTQLDKNENGLIERDEIVHEGARRYTIYTDIDGDKAMNEAEWALLKASMASVNAAICFQIGGTGNITDRALEWRYFKGIPQLPSPLVYRDVYYMLDDRGGLVTKLNPETGEKIDKGRLANAADNYFASPIAGDGKVYFLSEAGLLTVVDSARGFESVHSADFAAPCFATPAIEDGRIYLRAGNQLYCFGL